MRYLILLFLFIGSTKMVAQQVHAVTITMDTDCPLGVDIDESFKIYPNPIVSAEDALLSFEAEQPSILEILDFNGKQLMNLSIGRGVQTIDARGYPEGVYLFILHSEKRKQVAKIIIQ